MTKEGNQRHTPYKQQQPMFENKIPRDILDDLSSRFIINLPQEERDDIIRVTFQVELAYWFYKDFYCVNRPELVGYQFRTFAMIMFNHVPFLCSHLEQFDTVINEWREYKANVPTYGAIILDPTLNNVLMVQGFSSNASWGFPKGKINAEESPVDCAIREVKEEIGFDCSSQIDQNRYIHVKVRGTSVRLYIIPGVSMQEKFSPMTRGEIKSIDWIPVKSIPVKHDKTNGNIFFTAIPFMKLLNSWVDEQRRSKSRSSMKRHRFKAASLINFRVKWDDVWSGLTLEE